MIRYQLVCTCKHQFDSWFRSSDDFDHQKDDGLLACPRCGSSAVSKALMAPNLSSSGKSSAKQRDVLPRDRGEESLKSHDDEAGKIRTAMREMRAQITKNADYVGSAFTSVARDMHYGDAPERGIYGEANVSDVKKLKAEGINVLPLPSLPEEKN